MSGFNHPIDLSADYWQKKKIIGNKDSWHTSIHCTFSCTIVLTFSTLPIFFYFRLLKKYEQQKETEPYNLKSR